MKITRALLMAMPVLVANFANAEIRSFVAKDGNFEIGNKKVVEGQSIKLSWAVAAGDLVTLDGVPVTENTVTRIPIPLGSPLTEVAYLLQTKTGNVTDSRTIRLTRATYRSGKYVPERYADNCTPTAKSDFIAASRYAYVAPADCRVVKLQRPYFAWVQPEKLQARSQIKLFLTAPDGTTTTYSPTQTYFIVPETLKTTGKYTWYVTYVNAQGATVRGAERSFVYAPDDDAVLPTGQEVIALVKARKHPRMWPTENGQALTEAQIKLRLTPTELNKPYELFKQVVPLDLENQGEAVINLEKAMVAAVLSGDAKKKVAVIDKLKALAATTFTAEEVESDKTDLLQSAIMRCLALGYDLFYADLGTDRTAIYDAIVGRLAPSLKRMGLIHDGRDYTLMINPRNSHLLAIIPRVSQTLMHILDHDSLRQTAENAANEAYLAATWDMMLATMGAWGGDTDGGWGNSTNYGWIALNDYAPAAAAYQLMAGIDITVLPALKHFGENFYAQTARTRKETISSVFGDVSENKRSYLDYANSVYRLFALATRNPLDEWYYRDDVATALSSTYRMPYQVYLLSAIRSPALLPSDLSGQLKNSYLFEDAGVVAMHSNTATPDRSSLYFRSSPLGSSNHSHADSNSFTFVSRGQNVFISGGSTKSFESTVHDTLTRATRFKNALTFDDGRNTTAQPCVDSPATANTAAVLCEQNYAERADKTGIGQAEPKAMTGLPGIPVYDSRFAGKIINYIDGPSWTIATGDARDAYRKMDASDVPQPVLSAAYRTVAFNRAAGVAVIYDYAASTEPRFWQLNFQTAVPPVNAPEEFHPQQIRYTTTAGTVCLNYHGQAGTFHHSGNLAPSFEGVTQYHTSLKVNARAPKLFSITVITENCVPDVRVTYIGQEGKMLLHYKGDVLSFDQGAVAVTE